VRRAKIVATLGPALDEPERLRAAIEAGIDVVRLNFSHGTHEDHARRLEMVRQVSRRLGRTVGSLADLQGPKIRVGSLPPEGVALPSGGEVFLMPGREELDEHTSEGYVALPVAYEHLAEDVEPGSLVLIDDGSIRLVVSRIVEDGVWARIVVGGLCRSRKGVNLPGVAVSAPSMTEKDHADLAAAMDMGADWVALSFVRRPEDMVGARESVKALGGEAPLIAKLERPEAIASLEAVLEASDAVMVARGDLGVEIGPERVPAIQKEIIAQARAQARPVITATEMLESMINSPRPTRAEASDVANAVFDGTDALMLSAETASGRFPVEAVRTMARIIEVAEASPQLASVPPVPEFELSIGRNVARAAVQVARDVRAAAIVVYSISGSSLQLVSGYRPEVPLVGLIPSDLVCRRSALMWGAEARYAPMMEHSVELAATAERVLVEGEWAERGDLVVLVSGRPGGQGGTNRIMVHRIGDPVSG
jgi:pyruvate kinase